MKRKATCCSGATGIETKGDPVLHAVCHCSNCKTRTGSAFGLSAYFADAQIVNIIGETAVYEINNDNHQQRHFCPKCGTTLYWKISVLPGMTGIAGGCFTDAPLPEPDYTVSNTGKCAWVTLPDGWKTSIAKEDFLRK